MKWIFSLLVSTVCCLSLPELTVKTVNALVPQLVPLVRPVTRVHFYSIMSDFQQILDEAGSPDPSAMVKILLELERAIPVDPQPRPHEVLLAHWRIISLRMRWQNFCS
jgi:hypothetical protein